MSVVANTYEEMTIHNVDTGTAEVARQLGEYLLKTWGIYKLSLIVDGVHYGDNVEKTIQAGSGLNDVCAKLAEAKEIIFAMSSENGGGASWRLESCFMSALTDDEAIRRNIVYRSTDYYDTDSEVVMYLYDENGLHQPEYADSAECIRDIKRWYCYTPTLRIADAEQSENAEMHDTIMKALTELCKKCFGLDEDEIEDKLEDDWDDFGEIILNGSLSFASESIPEIVSSLNRLFEQVGQSDTVEIEFEMYAVPDGESDYSFASVAIAFAEGAVQARYCRF